ncbi:MAG: twin-arginine translocase TatA/TatE family subunit [Bacteroidales bacterium]|nr:twin-arginine translocase TatA/TatE family subunit [Bacteroidales bacterium]
MGHFLLFNIGGGEIALIALVILLLFGGRKIPELMRGIGKGLKSLKDGMNDIEKDIKDVEKDINDNINSD